LSGDDGASAVDLGLKIEQTHRDEADDEPKRHAKRLSKRRRMGGAGSIEHRKDNQLWKQVPLNPEASCTELGGGIHIEGFNGDSTDRRFAHEFACWCRLKMLIPLINSWIKKTNFDLAIVIDSRYAIGFMEIA
jgi:hypothetical protein